MDFVYTTFTLMILSALLHLPLTKTAYTITYSTGNETPGRLFVCVYLYFDNNQKCMEIVGAGDVVANAEYTHNIPCQHSKGLMKMRLYLICYRGISRSKCRAAAAKNPWYVKEITLKDHITPDTYHFVVNRRITNVHSYFAVCHNGGVNNEGTCRCDPRFVGTRCTEKSMCYNNKNCRNEGKCEEDIPNRSYTCACTPRFTGSHCETELMCYENKCRNGGACNEDFPNRDYTCTCLPGLTGHDCESELPKCYSSPCKRGGTCHDDFPNKWYKCSCLPAFIGEHCETVAPGECIHNRTCTFGRGTCTPIWLNATHGTYNCSCKSQYKGVNCEEEIVPEETSTLVLTFLIAPAMVFGVTFLICIIRAIVRCCKKCFRKARRPRDGAAEEPEDARVRRVFEHIAIR